MSLEEHQHLMTPEEIARAKRWGDGEEYCKYTVIINPPQPGEPEDGEILGIATGEHYRPPEPGKPKKP